MSTSGKNSPILTSLPNYERPPVNEVVFGIRFNTPEKLRLPHIGILWQKLQSEYPKIQHAPPIASAKGEIKIDLATGAPTPRLWFISQSDDQLAQFQVDRFYYNWRRRQSDYPRYAYVRKAFENVYDKILEFFDEVDLGDFEPIECELTFINHIPKGDGWETLDDLSKVFSDFIWNFKNERFLPKPQKFSWRSEFMFPDNKGRLITSLKHAIRSDDKIPLVVFDLNTLGFGKSSNKKDVLEWFDFAHEWIVRGFTDLTTAEIQKIWGKI
jgi:uncharacterized protein (TIGR04255 family)